MYSLKQGICTVFLLLLIIVLHAQTATVLWTSGDNSNAIKSALNGSATTIYLQPGKVYDISTHLIVPSGKTFDGQGSTLHVMSSYVTDSRPVVTTAISQTKNIGSLSLAITQGSYTFTYSGASNLVVGQLIQLFGPVYGTFNGASYSYGWYSEITGISGSTVTLKHPARVSFTASAIKCWKNNRNVTIKNLNVDCRAVSGGVGIIGAEYASNVTISGCIMQSNPSAGMKQGGRFAHVNDAKFTNCLVYNLDMSGGEAPAYSMSGNNDTVIYCRAINAASGTSGGNRDYISTLYYFNNEIAHHGSWTGLDFHANAQGEMGGNKIWMTNPNNFKLHTIHVRRGDTYVHDNIGYYPDGGLALLGVYMFEMGYYNNTITNNTFYYKTVAPNPVYHNTSSLAGTVTNETAYNNQVIQMSSIPAEPPAELMYPDGNTPTADTSGVVVVPPVVVEPCTTCEYNFDFVHFLPKQ